MRALGYPLTWTTQCFINPACAATVWAHTNGDGGFVLFDSLGPPWPVHECYQLRFEYAELAGFDIGATRAVAYDEAPRPKRDSILQIQPDAEGHQKRFHVLGTVTNTEPGFIGRAKQFHGLPKAVADQVKQVLAGRTAMISIVTGDGEEFGVFVDLKKMPVDFRDIVTADIKAVRLMNTSVFVVSQIRVFRSEGESQRGASRIQHRAV